MTAKELQDKTVEELRAELVELMKSQFNLRMQHATGQLANAAQLKTVRRSIARVKTIIRQKVSK
ncbi:MAG: 50S ribosomal protein L29 [Gammaproteobacteria bacterium]|jgi:large subunit ribosomal protein L29|uniref:50S ribosomal protein L29 n=1 Tax=Thiomicrorhabdus cannonii TaxID=2748011 RepID=UPI0015C0D180|nr:50S ribosomal protein L29 [Thiomicrorhabdus cannonii]MBD3754259.1 50S ribosomal protein L29 [Gammaproteobacteria bacterium]MBD3775581.1 50S ribosomal protein L29 [Thiotrichales bacterium]